MKGININARVTVTLTDDAEVFYKNYCMEQYNRPSIHVRNNDGSITMQLHEAMALSSAYPRISRSPFERGLICFDESSIIDCN